MTSLATKMSPPKPQMTSTLRVRGLVQGVGFRPTVWRLANRCNLRGNVLNDGKGVLINIAGTSNGINTFIQALHDECPTLARIDSIEHIPCTETITSDSFEIIKSDDATDIATGIVADAATCPACLDELNDTADRRYRYPFLNCTHCGPRFSIIRRIPYDRVNTSMAAFTLCDDCLAEYQNPADRRFHAQPTACANCGPAIWLCDNAGKTITTESNATITETARRLAQGAIVAIKGIGGIHLACDASNPEAVERLRQRKNRPDKPLALMAKDVTQIRRYCSVDALEENTLTSPAAPVVILDTLTTQSLPANIAPGQKQLGFMLPYSPLHHLLLAELTHPIILTSGNRSDEPQCIDNEDALKRLADIADVFLLHNRPIENRIDDSVARNMKGKIQLLRRARGYAPGHLPLPAGFENHPPLLALGGELKSTFCLFKNGHAILSQHMGDLEDVRTFDDYQKNLQLYLKLYAHVPAMIIADNHPEYLSTKYGSDYAEKNNVPFIQLQHHHAHIAACMIDNNISLDAGPVIGIAFDGSGSGDDATLWGGEFLLADYQSYKRLAHLKPVALPGGSQAMREPWRNTWAQLSSAFDWESFTEEYRSLELSQRLNDKPVIALQQMVSRDINSPLSSSAGRLFDAVAAALNVAPERCSYEGQAAIALEACIDKKTLQEVTPYHIQLNTKSDGQQDDQKKNNYELDPAPMWKSLLDDLKTDTASDVIAARFHRGLAQAIIDTAVLLAAENATDRVALSGGVFQNRTLFNLVVDGLECKKLQVLTHQQVPANDGGLALGQAAIAAARNIKESN